MRFSLYSIVCLANFLFLPAANAQAAISPAPVQPPSSAANLASDYSIAQSGAHFRLWRNATGQTVTEIATGMNYWDGRQWSPSAPLFQLSLDGSAFLADKIQDPTRLAANLNGVGAVSVTTPNGTILRSTPIAIVLYDTASGQSAVIASLTNSTGVLADPQDVVYNQALVGPSFAASVVYSLPDAGSFQQDVVFTAFDPQFDPTALGFASSATNTLQVQIFTEFYNPPAPQTITRPLYVEQDPVRRAAMVSPDFVDHTLDFGNYVFGPGRAYPAGADENAPGVTVAKEFLTENGRTFLIESIPYRALEGGLRALPPIKTRTSQLKIRPWRGHAGHSSRLGFAALLPSAPERLRDSLKSSKAPQTAMVLAKPRGVMVDYTVTVSSTVVPTLYASDTTYFVSGNVHNSSSVTMESAVFKYPTNNVGTVEISGPLTLATTNYRPAIFTAADDNTAGASLNTNIWNGYTGNPTGKSYGYAALWLNTTANIALNDLRFCFARIAIEISADTANQAFTLSHSQLVDCINGIYVSGGNGSGSGSGSGSSDSLSLNANNCLMANVVYPFQTTSIILAGAARNCTIDAPSKLLQFDPYTMGGFNFTNTILSSVASEGILNAVTVGGAFNGFYSSPTFGSSQFSISANPFQTALAGNYYLQTGSPLLSEATTNIGPSLLAQLQGKTTQPPQVLAGSIVQNTTLAPVVPRDAVVLALGFHYNPIDYVADCSVSNATLLLTNGLTIAYADNFGLWLQDGARLISQGAPNHRNYVVHYNSTQEEPTNAWGVINALAQSIPIALLPSGSTALPSLSLRLTTVCVPTGETNLLDTRDAAAGNQSVSSLSLRDCEIYASGADWRMNESNASPSVSITNNVFYRAPFAVSSQAQFISDNNLFYGSTNVSSNLTAISIHVRSGASANSHKNSVFDGVTVSLDGAVGYNGYIHGATNLTYTNNHDIFTNITWTQGPLGGYYQSSTSPFLNAGSAAASSLGLYHYTVLTNLTANLEIKETNSTIDLGYHYPATDSLGYPIDTDGDGLADYLEDANGNGLVDGSETSWTNYNSPNGLAVPNGLLVFTPLH